MRDSVTAAIRDALLASNDARLDGVNVYPHVRGPEKPAITVRMEEHKPLRVFGASSFGRAKMNLDCIANIYDRASEIADAVQHIFSDYLGTVRGVGPVNMKIDGRVDLVNEVRDTTSGGDAEVEYHTVVDIIVRRG